MTTANKPNNNASPQPPEKKPSTKQRFLKERMFGQIVLKTKKVSPKKLSDVILYQQHLKKQGVEKKIGELLVEAKCITSKELSEILNKQQAMDQVRKQKFGGNKKPAVKKTKSLSSLVRRYKKGDVIFCEGDSTNHDLYVIQQGEVGVYKNSIHLGKRFDRGAFIGITSCLLNTPRVSTVVALKDSVLLKIPEGDVQNFFAKNPHMALKLSSVLAQRVADITDKYVEVITERPELSARLQDPALIVSAENAATEKGNTTFVEPLFAEEQVTAVAGKVDSVQKKIEAKRRVLPEVEAQPKELDSVKEDDAKRVPKAETENVEPTVAKAPALQGVESSKVKSARQVVAGADKSDVQDTEESGGDAFASFAGTLEDDVEEVAQSKAKADAGGEDDAGGESIDEEQDETEEPVKIDPVEAILQDPDDSVVLPALELKEVIAQAQPLEFSESIWELLNERLQMYVKLEEVAAERDKLEAKSSTTDRASNELSSLRRELNKIPPYEQLKMKRDKLAEMVAAAEVEADTKPQLTADVIAAYKISVAQKDLLLNWYESMPSVLSICSEVTQNQLMNLVMRKVGVNPNEVFGWAVYVLALTAYQEELKERQKELKRLIKEIQDEQDSKKGGGLFSIFKKKPEVDEAEEEAKEQQKLEYEAEEQLYRLKLSGIMKETAAVESIMVDAFWAVYEALGIRLVKGVQKDCERYVRAYLRWGILGLGSDFIRPEILEELLAECDGGSKLAKFAMEANYILYADEVIELTAQKLLLPSPNEDLEMNERNSPRWKVDRAHRKIVGGDFYLSILKDLQSNLEEIAEENNAKRDNKEKELEAVAEDDPDRKSKVKAIKKSLQAYKIAAVKSTKLVEKARDEMSAKIQLDIDAGIEAMEELGMEADPEELARHEITCIRRFCRLIAKLQEPFLPFTLKDRFDPEMKTTNTRADMLAVLQDIEAKDPLIFKENMLSSMKKNNRVQIRTSPFIHLLPASGIMGFLVAPRSDTYSGKLMLPGYFERSGMREAIAVETFSDFRYDTSKEQAGNDVMNSDTLVAAYAEVRWILRKKDKEVRQKAGIFTDENERTNWRRHYAMYINSAEDAGKQLFFKCPDLYELIINKFIELPEGIEVLKRG